MITYKWFKKILDIIHNHRKNEPLFSTRELAQKFVALKQEYSKWQVCRVKKCWWCKEYYSKTQWNKEAKIVRRELRKYKLLT